MGRRHRINGVWGIWIRENVVVEPFAAAAELDRGGSRIATEITFDWNIPDYHMSLLKPGEWCALLVHPQDHSKVFLDGFAKPTGEFVPTVIYR
jgi:hypothetical protein